MNDVQQRRPGLERTVSTVRWDITGACNLRCRYCSSTVLRGTDCIPYDEAQRALTSLLLWGVRNISVLGGEPFLYPRLLSLLQCAARMGIRVELTTNATLPGPSDVASIVDAGLSAVHVSLDGPDSETNDRLRGDGVFKKATRMLMSLLAARESAQLPLQVCVSAVLTKLNAPRMAELVGMCGRAGVDSLRIAHMIPTGRAQAKLDDLSLPPDEELHLTGRLLQQAGEYPQLRLNVLDNSPLVLEYYYKVWGVERPLARAGCKAWRDELYLGPCGRMAPCSAIAHATKDGTLGHLASELVFHVSELSGFPPGMHRSRARFERRFPLDADSYATYWPCASCPYLGSICFPCPLTTARGVREKRLCAAALAVLWGTSKNETN